MASKDVCEDAEPEEVGREPSLCVEQTSRHLFYDGVIVHQTSADKIAFELKTILKRQWKQNGLCEKHNIETHGNVKSAPKYAAIEEIARSTKAVLVIWTPDSEKDREYSDYVNSLFSFMGSFQFDITTITCGFNGVTPKPCMAINNTSPVEFDNSDYFFDAMSVRLLKHLPERLCCNARRDDCKQFEQANPNEETSLKQVEAQPDHYADEGEQETVAQNVPTKTKGEHTQLKSGGKESGCAAYADDPLSDDVVPDADAKGVKHNPPTVGHCEAELRVTTGNKGYRRDSGDNEGGEYSLRETEGAMTEAEQSERPARTQESLESLEAGADYCATLTNAERPERNLSTVSDAELLPPSVQPDTSYYSCKPETENSPCNPFRKDLSYNKEQYRSGKDDSAVNSALKHTTGKDEVSVSERDRAPATFSYQGESIGRKHNSPAALVSESSEDTCQEPATSSGMDELNEDDPNMKKKTSSERAEGNTNAGSENECAIEQEASSARRDCGSKGGQGQKQVVNDATCKISSVIGKDFVQKEIDGAGGKDQNNKYASRRSDTE